MNALVRRFVVPPDTDSKRHLSVFWRGVEDAVEGRNINPYHDHRCGPYDNCVTGSRGYRNFWRRGHDAGMAALPRYKAWCHKCDNTGWFQYDGKPERCTCKLGTSNH